MADEEVEESVEEEAPKPKAKKASKKAAASSGGITNRKSGFNLLIFVLEMILIFDSGVYRPHFCEFPSATSRPAGGS